MENASRIADCFQTQTSSFNTRIAAGPAVRDRAALKDGNKKVDQAEHDGHAEDANEEFASCRMRCGDAVELKEHGRFGKGEKKHVMDVA